MASRKLWFGLAGLVLWLWPTCLGYAQQLIISNGLVVLPGITNTTVVLTGRCELQITGSNNPIPGCTIHLNSPDAWFALVNIRPSVVATGYLSQVRVNGAAAVVGSNVRLDQYGMGTVLIPHGPGYRPLEVFAGPHFTGASTNLALYTYYTNTALGGFNCNIGSFRLRRGYMATFAQNYNGTGASVVYVAQDGDLDVGALPPALDRACSFVRVFPWRWTAKKGWAGDVQTKVAPHWFYDWDNTDVSTTDAEYVPMRWGQYWNSYANINAKQKSTHVLGFNEPDKSDQANMTVAAAIAEWPNLMQSGLRVGSPAVSDSATAGMGLDWLYSFMDQADALGYRVDFVAIHFYKCDWSASQLYNYLLGIYRRTRRPIWVTEFNNGANWCSSTPTYEQNAAVISNFLAVLEDAYFVERYAIYNWVGTNRAMVLDDGTLTPAGVIYRDRQSGLAFRQTYPWGARRGIAQLGFENSFLDGSGFGNNGLGAGLPQFVSGRVGQALWFDGTNNWVQLPAMLARSNGFTFAAWVYWSGGPTWQRIFDFGNDTFEYMFLTPNSGGNTLRFAITTNGYGSEQRVEMSGFTSNQWYHVAVTLSNNVCRLYVNGTLRASSSSFTLTPALFKPARNYLGKSQFPVDPLFRGMLDEVYVADYALAPQQIAALMTNRPPVFATKFIEWPGANIGMPYSNSVAGLASDPDPGDSIAYSKASGPDWVNVAADGTVTGTPGPDDSGTNYVVIRATDWTGLSDYTVVMIPMPVVVGDGIWVVDRDGYWSDTNCWAGGLPANGRGKQADFSAINITANRTVYLDYSRSLGSIKFGDLSGAQSWTITTTNGSVLTLDTGTTAKPALVVTNTPVIAVCLAGTNGFAKSGPGTLVLAASNALQGEIDIDTARTSGSDGAVRAAHPAALANVARIRIRNNNDGTSTLQLDGSNGGIQITAPLEVNCRNQAVPTIQNLSGTNVISGPIWLNVGGSMFNVQSDAGLLILAGTNQYIGSLTGARSYFFLGAGDHLVSGPILNPTNGAPVSLYKSGTGMLTLAGTNTFTGPITNVVGTLRISGRVASSNIYVLGGTLTGTGRISGSVWVGTSARLAPGTDQPGSLQITGGVTNTGTFLVRVSKTSSGLTNDAIAGVSTVAYGGVLQISNVGPGIITAGDSFRIVQATNYTGAFAAVVPSTPGPGLVWDTSQLAVNGTLRVALGSVSPTFTEVRLGDGAVVVRGTGGAAGYPYVVLSTTNPVLPLADWIPVATNACDGNGQFAFTNAISGDEPARFFTVCIPR